MLKYGRYVLISQHDADKADQFFQRWGSATAFFSRLLPIIRTYINELMAGSPAPSDSDARAYYDQHPSDYRTEAMASLSHIQLKTEVEAKRVLAWAKAGQDWSKLAQRFSTDTLTRASGGALGTVTREGVFSALGPQPALAESAFAWGSDKIGGPVKTNKGWSVVRVDKGRRFEGTRPSIRCAR
jgi:parvulin-like peptidyl-prolyl isomerase